MRVFFVTNEKPTELITGQVVTIEQLLRATKLNKYVKQSKIKKDEKKKIIYKEQERR